MSSSGTLFPCAICFETAADPVVTRCGHLFCWPCLDQWLHIGNADCPVCKGRVDENKDGDIIPLYGVSSSEKAGPSSASQESSLSGDANPSLSHAAPKPSPMHQSEQRQQQQHQHAFHRRTARPTPTDVPGGRRAGNNGWSSYVRGMVVGGPTLFIGDFYIFILITLLWAALTKGGPLIKDHVLPVVKRAYRHVLSRLREGHAPDTRETASATAADRSIRTNVALSVRWVLFFAAVSFLIYQAIALCLWIRSSRLLNFYVL